MGGVAIIHRMVNGGSPLASNAVRHVIVESVEEILFLYLRRSVLHLEHPLLTEGNLIAAWGGCVIKIGYNNQINDADCFRTAFPRN
jgi:hypothetical protein